MKKWFAALAAAVLLVGVGVAVAVGGSETDPLISRSYIEETYLPRLAKELQKRAAEKTQGAYSAAVTKLDGLGEEDITQAGAIEAEDYLPQTVARGGHLELQTGGSLVFYSGSCNVAEGVLADVTSGKTVREGDGLLGGHRYIVTSKEAASLQMTAESSLGYQGAGTLQKEGVFPFADVFESDWYYKSVRFVYEAGYFSGTAADTFSPGSPMTRAMLATVLFRFSESLPVAGPSQFTDVPDDQWYSEGIAWASAFGVVNGMGDGLYMPNNNITREQMVTMLFRYMRDYQGADTTQVGDLTAFTDSEKVSDWAQEAMVWAVGAGVINGRADGRLDPAGMATRAEVATVLHRFAGLVDFG